MVEYLKVNNGKIESADESNGNIIRMVSPDSSEIEKISLLTGAPADFLSAACDRDERPRFEADGNIYLFIIRVPYEEAGSDLPVITVAFAVIITPVFLISVCSIKSPVWEALQKIRAPLPQIEKRILFLCNLLLGVARLYLTHLQLIRTEADTAEKEIHHSMKNEMLIRMLNLEKCLVFFTTSLRGHEALWGRIRRLQSGELSEDETDLLEDVQIEFKQAQDLAEIYSNILSGMMDAFASVISNNLNVVMKLLTGITIILMLPTLIASIYGMNITLPFQNSPKAFLITMSLSVFLSFMSVLLFLKKKFF
ncbi:MAG TPA: magnesium transporter [Spirochaetia bacterium]|nr:magnesium transporter [Spirochaetia bacterium]